MTAPRGLLFATTIAAVSCLEKTSTGSEFPERFLYRLTVGTASLQESSLAQTARFIDTAFHAGLWARWRQSVDEKPIINWPRTGLSAFTNGAMINPLFE